MTETSTQGQSEEDKSRRRRKGQMLAPTKTGPIEVTPETAVTGTAEPIVPAPQVPAQEAAPQPVAAEPGTTVELKESPSGINVGALLPASVVELLESELPDKDAEPSAVISAAEQRLHAANLLQEAMQKRIASAYFYYAGPAVRLMWETERWRDIIDQSTGKPMRSFSAWLRSVSVSRQHAYRMTQEQPLLEALADHQVTQLNTKQIDALYPVLTQFGDKAVREIWASGVGWGDTSGPALLKIRDQLGYAPDGKHPSGGELEASSRSLPVLRFQTRSGTFNADQVRQAARAQPEIARLVALEILAELGEEVPGAVSRDTASGT